MTENKPTLEYATPLRKARPRPSPLRIRWWYLVITMASAWALGWLLLGA